MSILPLFAAIDNGVFVIDILNIENLKRIQPTLYTIHIKECKGRN